jgi:hypothetical protein
MVPTEGFFLDDEKVPRYVSNEIIVGEEPGGFVGGAEHNSWGKKE